MISLVANRDVLVFVSLINIFNYTKGHCDRAGDDGGPALDCDWLYRVASHQIVSNINNKGKTFGRNIKNV